MTGKSVLLRVMWFLELLCHVISHYPVKFGVHRACGIGNIAVFICRETTNNHVTKESCDFVYIGPVP